MPFWYIFVSIHKNDGWLNAIFGTIFAVHREIGKGEKVDRTIGSVDTCTMCHKPNDCCSSSRVRTHHIWAFWTSLQGLKGTQMNRAHRSWWWWWCLSVGWLVGERNGKRSSQSFVWQRECCSKPGHVLGCVCVCEYSVQWSTLNGWSQLSNLSVRKRPRPCLVEFNNAN